MFVESLKSLALSLSLKSYVLIAGGDFSIGSHKLVWNDLSLCLRELLEQVGDDWSSHFACLNSYLEIWLASAAQASAVQIHRAICTWRGNWARRRSGPVSVFSQKDCLWTDVLWCFSQKMDSGERKCLSITEVLCITAIFNLENESLKVLNKILSTVTTFFVSSEMQPGVICKVATVRLWGDLSAGEAEWILYPTRSPRC